jgi:hypothetical protein
VAAVRLVPPMSSVVLTIYHCLLSQLPPLCSVPRLLSVLPVNKVFSYPMQGHTGTSGCERCSWEFPVSTPQTTPNCPVTRCHVEMSPCGATHGVLLPIHHPVGVLLALRKFKIFHCYLCLYLIPPELHKKRGREAQATCVLCSSLFSPQS